MPAPINEIVKRKVIQQWLAGEAREKKFAITEACARQVHALVTAAKIQNQAL
jgi:hypothetical protein